MSFLAGLDKVIKEAEKVAFKRTFDELTADKLGPWGALPKDASMHQESLQIKTAKRHYGIDPKAAYNLYADKNAHL